MWIVAALFTAVCWGFCYVCAEQAIKHVDKSVYLVISGALNCLFWIVLFISKSKTSMDFDKAKWWLAGAVVAAIIGNFLSIKAIELKNATYASVIEISYPIWCAFFTILLIGTNPLTWRSTCGIILVMLGTTLFVLGEK